MQYPQQNAGSPDRPNPPGKQTSINWSQVGLMFFVSFLASLLAMGLLLFLTKKLVGASAPKLPPTPAPAPLHSARHQYVRTNIRRTPAAYDPGEEEEEEEEEEYEEVEDDDEPTE